MRVVRGLTNFPKKGPGCVVTIGNFDGVHLGHQAIINTLADKGSQLDLPVVVILFEPQPLEYFRPDNGPARLSRLREKVALLSQLPVDYVLILRFNRDLSMLTASDFVQKILIEGMNTRYLLVGDDFKFGYQRQGNFELLQLLAANAKFVVEKIDSHYVRGCRVSSTLIRSALAQGDLDIAERCLGQPYSIVGRVVHGDQKGRSIGFPTANIRLRRKNTPVQGVFAVTMTRYQNREWRGVANVGVRPTFGGGPEPFLEVHLFDFSSDIYRRMVEVSFHAKLREEQKFGSISELRQQIQRDVDGAKEFFDRRARPASQSAV